MAYARLSPVWLSDAMLGGALLFGLAILLPTIGGAAWCWPPGPRDHRAVHAWMWPHCVTRLEGVSPEVQRLWLNTG